MSAHTKRACTHIEWRERGSVSACTHKTSGHTHSRVEGEGKGEASMCTHAHKTSTHTHRVEGVEGDGKHQCARAQNEPAFT